MFIFYYNFNFLLTGNGLLREFCYDLIKVALAHPAASNGVCSRHRSKFR